MINLYQILNVPPYANKGQIQTMLQHYQNSANPDPKVIKAVQDWLLVDDVRARYDERLRQAQPDFFQAAAPAHRTPTPISHDDEPEDVALAESPMLWNPKAASIWAFFLSPVLGSWLYALNYRELGDEAEAQKHMKVVWGLLVLYVVFMLITILTGFNFPLIISLLIWFAWYFGIAQQHINEIQNEFGDDYERRPWLKPIGLTVLAYVGYFVLYMILAFLAMIAGVIHPSMLN
ncbi:hypothetical protein [Alysiella filiformis]|uniref:Uncharacterized protein n=1 Tax=Alysiella filiformis DSM 16848 TaxID=1120981 RepID=A0A286E478_9NEIS|nr:hypothetical protein [Alysiella filiformis]QMT30996.1 hypothetical protein H3L97_09745 [Alysiella filiformis]UBQ56016.1 hypothetical protein JF568_10725 [Alysiella filiformis DSM 16848]SOD65728.1 hypothetical protein SAMN02746062_00401 [Alysiella filiformis DSM 16848]